MGIGHFEAASVADVGRGSGCVEPFGAGAGPGAVGAADATGDKPGSVVSPVAISVASNRPTTKPR